MSPRLITPLLLVLLTGCQEPRSATWQGYVEGETQLIAAPMGGILQAVTVHEGERVHAGAPLFALDPEPLQAELERTTAELAARQAERADLEKGRRAEEIAVIEAQYQQAQTAAGLAKRQWQRQRELYGQKLTSRTALDEAEAEAERSRRRLQEMAAQLETARLPARDDQLSAAQARIEAARAAQAQARWQLQQSAQAAPADGLIQQRLYLPGEYVAAGRPVVALLPPERIKVRFFVPEPALSGLRTDTPVRVSCDGCTPFSARIGYISPQAEYTPPVIYSRESRAKLVYRVEAWPEPGMAADLHPGQPVDVTPITPAEATDGGH